MALPQAGEKYKYIDNIDSRTKDAYPYRIVSLVQINDILPDTEGGCVASTTCVPQDDNSWISYNVAIDATSMVYEDSFIDTNYVLELKNGTIVKGQSKITFSRTPVVEVGYILNSVLDNNILDCKKIKIINSDLKDYTLTLDEHYSIIVKTDGLLKSVLYENNNEQVVEKTETIGSVDDVFKYSYDANGRLLQVENDNVTEIYSYDENGNIINTNIGGSIITPEYNADNQIITYGDISCSYDNDGRLISKSSPNEAHTYLYNDIGLLKEVDLQRPVSDNYRVYDNNPEGATILPVHDDIKNSNVIETLGDKINNGYMFGYTSQNSSASWNSTDKYFRCDYRFSESLTFYISVTTKDGVRYIWSNLSYTDRGLNSTGTYIHVAIGDSYSYGTWGTFIVNLEAVLEKYHPGDVLLSVNGFLVRGSGRLDNMITASSDGVETVQYKGSDSTSITYQYNSLSQPTVKSINNVIVEKYVWNESDNLLQINDKNDNVLKSFTYDKNTPITMTEDGKEYILDYDHVNNLRIVSTVLEDDTVEVVKEITYDAYGKILNTTNPYFGPPFSFAGGLKDVDTRLIHFKDRDYDPTTRKLLTKQTKDIIQGVNAYEYALDDPINYNDIEGTGLMHSGTATISTSNVDANGILLVYVDIENTGDIPLRDISFVGTNMVLDDVIVRTIVPGETLTLAIGSYDVNSIVENTTLSLTVIANTIGDTEYTISSNDVILYKPGTLSDTYTVDSLPIHANTIVIDILGNDNIDVNDVVNVDIVHVDATTLSVDDIYRGRLYIPNEGLWLVDYSTMQLTFTPDDGFTKDPTPIEYRVINNVGIISNTSTVNIDYINKTVLVDDVLVTRLILPTTINILDNDIFDNDINKDSLTIVGDYTDVNGSLNVEGTQLTIPDVAVWTVNRIDGNILCTPEEEFDGITSVEYIVKDMEGSQSNVGVVTITYDNDKPPVTVNDSIIISTRPNSNAPTYIDILENDTDIDSQIIPESISILNGVDTNDDGYNDRLLVSNEGTWSVVSGKIQFVPLTTFYGDPTPIEYTIEDVEGKTSNASTVTIDYLQTVPIANDITVIDNSVYSIVSVDVKIHVSDADGDVDYTTVSFVDDNVTSVDGGSNNKLVVENEGVWLADENGIITFTPDNGFTKDPTPIEYRVTDTTGLVSNTATITFDYKQSPKATIAFTYNDNQVLTIGDVIDVEFVLSNTGTLDLKDLFITSDAITNIQTLTKLVVGERVDTITGKHNVTENDFINKGITLSATLHSITSEDQIYTTDSTPVFIPLNSAPIAKSDSKYSRDIVSVQQFVTNNDTDLQNDIDVTSIRLIVPAFGEGTEQDTTGNGITDEIVVIGEGVWNALDNGSITFTPENGLVTNPNPIEYTIKDLKGLESNNTTVTVTYDFKAKLEILYSVDMLDIVKEGGVLTYTLSTINTGNVPVENISITSNSDVTISELENGVYSITHTVTEIDVGLRMFNFTLIIQGDSKDGSVYRDNYNIDTVLAVEEQAMYLDNQNFQTTEKSSITARGKIGIEREYTLPDYYAVGDYVYIYSTINTNLGSVEVNNINIIDTAGTPMDLGDNRYLTKVKITDRHIFVGKLESVLTVTGTDNDGNNVVSNYTLHVDIDEHNSYIRLNTSISNTIDNIIGDKLNYVIDINVIGVIDFKDISFSANDVTIELPDDWTALRYNYTHTITEEDLKNGVVNTTFKSRVISKTDTQYLHSTVHTYNIDR